MSDNPGDYEVDDTTRRVESPPEKKLPAPLPETEQTIPRRGYSAQRQPHARPIVQPPPAYTPNRQYGVPPGTPPPPRRRRKNERLPRDSGLYLPWWSLVILVFVVGLTSFTLLFFVANLSSTDILGNQTPRVIVVTSQINPGVEQNAAFPTAIPTGAAESGEQGVNLPTAQPTQTSIPGGCLLNTQVEVYKTGQSGLRLREQPRIEQGNILFIAPEGDILQVVDGPIIFDGIEWCKVESITRPGQFGWASLEFLKPAETIAEEQEENGAE